MRIIIVLSFLASLAAACTTVTVRPPQLPEVKVDHSSKYFDLDFSTTCQKVVIDGTQCIYCVDKTAELHRPALLTCDWAKVAQTTK